MPVWKPYPGSGSGGGAGGNGPGPFLTGLFTTVIITGGVAQTALEPGQRTQGGWIANPTNAGEKLGINEVGGDAAGTDTNGDTFFIDPGVTYDLASSSLGVSVIAATTGHIFGGVGKY